MFRFRVSRQRKEKRKKFCPDGCIPTDHSIQSNNKRISKNCISSVSICGIKLVFAFATAGIAARIV
jgi:hypothetical protein